jgi:hypothetical protein
MPIPLPVAEDGFCHPSNEEEIVALIKWCYENNSQLRVRGSAHTFPNRAVFTDHPPGRLRAEVNLMLDRYCGVRWVSEASEYAEVEVEAGCHFSVDPHDPTHQSTVETGLLYQLQQKGFALEDLGGITHQTIGGFLSTGSSGGSVKFGIDDNILKLRFIDGTGEIHEVSESSERDVFRAVGVSMGLLGLISKVTFRCRPTFNVVGSESTTEASECEIDLFGDGVPGKLSLQTFLSQTDYARLMWWPQQGLERIVVWKALRSVPPDPPSAFVPKQYQELGGHPLESEVLGGLLLSIIGNLDDLPSLPERIEPIFEQLNTSLIDEIKKRGFSPAITFALSAIASGLLESGVDGVLDFPGIGLVSSLLKKNLPAILPAILKPFTPLDAEKKPPGPQAFQDYWWTGLPMDNGIDDLLIPTWFTEIWIPIDQTKKVMCALRDYFETKGLTGTGTYAFEVYAAKESPFWMSPSHGSPVVRVDVFWFGYNSGIPEDFYLQFWELLKPFGFKLHWGKYLPRDPHPAKTWVRYFEKNNPNWQNFCNLRARLDPRNIFLTEYWREHLGLEAAQPRRTVQAPMPRRDPFASQAWLSAERAVTMFSWLLAASALYAILAAHLPSLLGHPWTSCQPPQTASPRGCMIAYHLLEAPYILYLLFLSWSGFKRLRPQPSKYAVLLSFGIALLAVFELFQFIQILDDLRRSAPHWEVLALYSFATLMVLGIVLGLYTRIKLAVFLEPVRRGRPALPWGW